MVILGTEGLKRVRRAKRPKRLKLGVTLKYIYIYIYIYIWYKCLGFDYDKCVCDFVCSKQNKNMDFDYYFFVTMIWIDFEWIALVLMNVAKCWSYWEQNGFGMKCMEWILAILGTERPKRVKWIKLWCMYV